MTERDFAKNVVEQLQHAGYQALWAGGCVRDELLGLTPADYDIATSATPEQVQQQFRRCQFFGASFGVVEVQGPKDDHGNWIKVQVATFRNDGTYTDGRRPDSVIFSTPEEDAARRDFTINGLFLDPLTGTVYDFVSGQNDLAAKTLRAIGEPAQRFQEDKLRLLRAVRMAARFQLTIEANTFAAMRDMASSLIVVSAERIAEELRKIFQHPNRYHGIRLLAETGLLAVIFPEANLEHHRHAQFQHLQIPPGQEFPLLLAMLLAPMTEKEFLRVSNRLRLSHLEVQQTRWLLTCHAEVIQAIEFAPHWLYPILVHPLVGSLLAWLEVEAHPRVSILRNVLATQPMTELDPPPLLNGQDLKRLGLKPGPQFGFLLQKLREHQLDGQIRTQAEAEEKILEWSHS